MKNIRCTQKRTTTKKTSSLLAIVAAVLLVVSCGLFVFPIVSKETTKANITKAHNEFNNTVANVQDGSHDEAQSNGEVNEEGFLVNNDGTYVYEYPVVYTEDLSRLYDDSLTYNQSLLDRQDMDIDFSLSALELSDYGIYNNIYGYLAIESIGISLPIYLGSTDTNLAYGVTHLMNTSLPIGGTGTNSVLAGHTGYIGKTFFDALPSLESGNIVTVTNYFETLTYSVVDSKKIGPTDTNDLYIQNEKDILTLITCSDAGKNRYEVICERI